MNFKAFPLRQPFIWKQVAIDYQGSLSKCHCSFILIINPQTSLGGNLKLISRSSCLLVYPGSSLDFAHEMQMDSCKYPKGLLCLTQTRDLLLLFFSRAEVKGCGNRDGLGTHIQHLNSFKEKRKKNTELRWFLSIVMSKVTFKFK